MVLALGRYPELSLTARLCLDEERGHARQRLTGLGTPESDDDMTVAALVEKFTASLHTHRRNLATRGAASPSTSCAAYTVSAL